MSDRNPSCPECKNGIVVSVSPARDLCTQHTCPYNYYYRDTNDRNGAGDQSREIPYFRTRRDMAIRAVGSEALAEELAVKAEKLALAHWLRHNPPPPRAGRRRATGYGEHR